MATRRLGLSPKQRNSIQNMFVDLQGYLRHGYLEITDRLFAKNIITASMKEEIECEQQVRVKISKLLSMVMYSARPDVFDIFLQALEEADMQHVAEALREDADEPVPLQATCQSTQMSDRVGNMRTTWQKSSRAQDVDAEEPAGVDADPVPRPGLRTPARPYVCQDRQPAPDHPLKLHIPPSRTETEVKTPDSSAGAQASRTPIRSPSWKTSWQISFEAGEARYKKDGTRISFKKHPQEEGPNLNLTQTQPATVGGGSLPQQLKSMTLRDDQRHRGSSPFHSTPADELAEVSEIQSVGESYTINRVELSDDPHNPATRIEITLQRHPKESFGFRFVSGLGRGRARFDGDHDYYITMVSPNTIAARCGNLQEHDTIVSINNIPIRHMQYNAVIDMFQKATQVTLIVERFEHYDVSS